MEFVFIPPGEFVMGLSQPPEDIRAAPPHRVMLTHPLYMGRFEVTQGEWQQVMGDEPSRFSDCGDACPVESVSWHEVDDFLARLMAMNPGERFRLPSEAEWEYACRAGSDARFGDDIDTLRGDRANFDTRIPFDGVEDTLFVGRPTPVGRYPASSFGLHDMVGNVWEWTADEYCPYSVWEAVDPLARCGTDTVVIRGGSWYFSANAGRCGRRYTHARHDSGFSLGFRVVREVATN
jgi:formylglycine-generating enzyme required for sulfatase activity